LNAIERPSAEIESTKPAASPISTSRFAERREEAHPIGRLEKWKPPHESPDRRCLESVFPPDEVDVDTVVGNRRHDGLAFRIDVDFDEVAPRPEAIMPAKRIAASAAGGAIQAGGTSQR
jgi:hypothetical protein